MNQSSRLKWLTFEEAPAAFLVLVEEVAAILSKARAQHGNAHLVLSGGRTPAQYLPFLADIFDDWQGITISLSDERWVSVTHVDSNEFMIRKYFLDRAPGAEFVSMMGDAGDPKLDAHQASTVYDQLRWPADMTILGAAPDGHVASLFPGKALKGGGQGDRVRATQSSTGDTRLSLSPEALLSTRQIVIVSSGKDKRAALQEAMNPGSIDDVPVRLLLAQKIVPVTIIDYE